MAESCSDDFDVWEDVFKNFDNYGYELPFDGMEDKVSCEVLEVKSLTSSSKGSKALSIVDKEWELIDPHPDVHALFLEYDSRFFYGKLQGVEVKWSPRMTLCAGVCSYEGRGGLCSIRLSLPLLKYRPRRDLVETLLHEMIHAYLFVTCNNKDREGHGPEFLSHMHRINKESGAKITVFHSFHDEVNLYKQHWWKCDGPCKDRRPFYGLVKRAMNRAPGPNDTWWASHQATCGGKFTKIKEPENYKKIAVKRKLSDSKKEKSSDIRSFFKHETSKTVHDKISDPSSSTSRKSDITSLLHVHNSSSSGSNLELPPQKKFVPFQGNGFKLGGASKSSVLSPYLLPEHSKQFNSSHKVGTLLLGSNSSIDRSFSDLDSSSKQKIQNIRLLGSSDRKIKDSISQRSTPSKSTTNSLMDNFLSSKSAANPLFLKSAKENLKVECPVCFLLVEKDKINPHLDICISN